MYILRIILYISSYDRRWMHIDIYNLNFIKVALLSIKNDEYSHDITEAKRNKRITDMHLQ